MRSEISYVRRNFLRRRLAYITDLDGAHEKKGLKVRSVWIGVGNADEFADRVRELVDRPPRRGAPLRYVAWEITAHPADTNGATAAFASQDEMIRVAREIVKQMHAVVALVGCHGLRDIHVLLMNDGPTGRGLKSYLPNRSNPRRVMVATLDRIEAQVNSERSKAGMPRMLTMEENRAKERRRLGRKSLTEMLLAKVPDKEEPDIATILAAFRRNGWRAEKK